MLNTTPLDTAETRLGVANAVEQHLRRRGASLCDLLDALDDSSGFATLCDLYGAFRQPIRNADTVEGALRAIQPLLADQTPSSLDRIGHERGQSTSDLMRWYGARVGELRARFHHAQ